MDPEAPEVSAVEKAEKGFQAGSSSYCPKKGCGSCNFAHTLYIEIQTLESAVAISQDLQGVSLPPALRSLEPPSPKGEQLKQEAENGVDTPRLPLQYAQQKVLFSAGHGGACL